MNQAPGRAFAGLSPPHHKSRAVLFFALFPVPLIAFVSISVSMSKRACSFHPECAVHAKRWVGVRDGDRWQCPCIALVGIDTAPASFTDWLVPVNATEKLAQLSATGDLEAIQLINRQLTVFPETLRRCSNLNSLYYMSTEPLPSWSKEFTSLEYLNV
ncbi:hypothetical protein Gpo141_00014916 [Globisporangium polare]